MVKKILIINPFGIGDVLFSTALVSIIRKKLYGSNIGYICNIRTKEILETNPEVDEVFVFERDEYRALWRKSKIEAIRKFFNFWRDIGKRRFDTVIDLSLGKEYAFLCWLVGIKDRRGFNYKGRGRFLTYKIPFDGFNDKPIAEYYLDLLGSRLGLWPRSNNILRAKAEQSDAVVEKNTLSMVLISTDKDQAYVDNFLKNAEVKKQDILIGIAPGGGAAFGRDNAHYKRWPWQKFAELIDRITELGMRPILLWGPGEEDLVKNIQEKVSHEILIAPTTKIREMAVLMKRCKSIVCNDGGMLHIAVSQGVPTVSVFGPTDEKVYGPYPPGGNNVVITSKIECRPCYKRFKLPECKTKKCLKDISVDTVFNALP